MLKFLVLVSIAYLGFAGNYQKVLSPKFLQVQDESEEIVDWIKSDLESGSVTEEDVRIELPGLVEDGLVTQEDADNLLAELDGEATETTEDNTMEAEEDTMEATETTETEDDAMETTEDDTMETTQDSTIETTETNEEMTA